MHIAFRGPIGHRRGPHGGGLAEGDEVGVVLEVW
jgi:hypothetical protein